MKELWHRPLKFKTKSYSEKMLTGESPKRKSNSEIHQKGVIVGYNKLQEEGLQVEKINSNSADLLIQPLSLYIRVSVNAEPKPAGGKGSPLLHWWVPKEIQAQFIMLVDLSSEKVWLFKTEEFFESAQQHTEKKSQLYIYTDSQANPRTKKPAHEREFIKYLLENRIKEFFPSSQ